MLFCDIHCVENSLDSVLFPLRNSIVNWSVKPLPYYFASALYAMVVSIRPPTCGLPVAILEFVVYRDPTGCLTAFYFSPFEVRDDSNPSGDGLPHLSRIKLGGAATAGKPVPLLGEQGTPINGPEPMHDGKDQRSRISIASPKLSEDMSRHTAWILYLM